LLSSQDENASEGSIATAEWVPAVDIKEESDKFVILADIPGVKPEDIEVSMEGGVLTVKGTKDSEAKTEKKVIKGLNALSVLFIVASVCPILLMTKQLMQNAKMAYLRLLFPSAKPLSQNASMYRQKNSHPFSLFAIQVELIIFR